MSGRATKPQPDAQAPADKLSLFLDRWRADNPERVRALADAGRLNRADVAPVPEAPDPADESDFDTALRAYRNETLAVIAWRDLAAVDALENTLASLSLLAARCIEAGLRYAQISVAERYGWMRDSNGHPQRLTVLGMGKLGGRELNFSSDVDLIFTYRESGESDGARALDASAYYTRVAQKLVQCLSETTAEGFVYRVDTRLRPFGDAGALVASHASMEHYYQAHGRDWERYAWIKARPVAGDIEGGERLIDRLQPFVYRRYLDYGTFASIREMKAMVDRQVVRAELQDNIKLGRGGIREIEFIVQAFQLIRGGQEPILQSPFLLPTLSNLAEAGHVPAHTAEALEAAYRFLRMTENRLQMVDDRQTHDLPRTTAARTRLAQATGYSDWAALESDIKTIRQQVQDAFEQTFASPQAEDREETREEQRLLSLWEGDLGDDSANALLTEYGVTRPEAIRKSLAELQDQSLYRGLKDAGRRWFARLMPLLFSAASEAADPDRALIRTLEVISAIVGRSTYIALLVEHPVALSTLMRLCAASEWITARITAQPVLLDSLLDPRHLYAPPRRAELAENLSGALDAIEAEDLEHRMDALRRFTQTAKLRIAAADIGESMPLMIVSDNLTELAEVVVQAGLALAWDAMQQRYGTPRRDDGSPVSFAAVAYGKMGGLELGYTSDLDLVFIHDGEERHTTDGARAMTPQAFFTRLAQRLIHILSLQTPAGRAYEIDMRLRPSGQAGLMVTHINAFERYQREQAWTWEHQALVRARAVAGDTGLGRRFETLRTEILAQPRELAQLAGAVSQMRARMRRAKDQSTDGFLDVKQMPGGLIDIEFMAQFAALRYGHECREVVMFTDAIRILETLESGGIAAYEDIALLTNTYRGYRRLIHSHSLQRQRAMIPPDTLKDARQKIVALWHEWIGKHAKSNDASG